MPTDSAQTPAARPAEDGAALVVIDVRTEGEFERGALDGAVCLPLARLAREIGSLVPDRHTPVALYCATGARSAMASAMLTQLGYRQVSDAGGLFMAAARLGRALKP